MNHRTTVRPVGLGGNRRLAALAAVVVIAAVAPLVAASIPAWLDDGISKWNAENPATPLRFVDIKDSFVWYDVVKTPEIGSQRIREGVHKVVLAHGYQPLDDEESVTTGKPPAKGSRQPKKCWSRSFVLNLQAQADTKAVGDDTPGQRQRMLTSLVCDDASTYWAGFRVAD